jgi:hypothetical protein
MGVAMGDHGTYGDLDEYGGDEYDFARPPGENRHAGINRRPEDGPLFSAAARSTGIDVHLPLGGPQSPRQALPRGAAGRRLNDPAWLDGEADRLEARARRLRQQAQVLRAEQ